MTIKSLVNRSNILLRAIIKKALFSLSRHESTAHSGTTVQTEQDQQDGAGKEGAKEDFLFNYHQAKLTFGLILFEFDDAIKEGDGDRLHDFYRFGLLWFKAYVTVQGKTYLNAYPLDKQKR